MKLSEIYKIANELAPKALSDEYCAKYGAYDNSGVLVDCGEEITKILFALDFSSEAIDYAIEIGAQLIMTHHPAIYGRIGRICVGDSNPLGGKLIKCAQNGISVLSMHLNLDVAKGGIDESLQEGILCSASVATGAGVCSDVNTLLFQTVGDVGYGRVYNLPSLPFSWLIEGVEKTFGTKRLWAFGDKDKMIARVASFCGAGGGEEEVAFAAANGADLIISAEFKQHVLLLCKELGLAALQMTHYASEYYGFEKYYEKMSRQAGIECICFKDNDLL